MRASHISAVRTDCSSPDGAATAVKLERGRLVMQRDIADVRMRASER